MEGEFSLQNGTKVKYKVVNMVVNLQLPSKVNLEKSYEKMLSQDIYDAIYNPEEFPGLVIKKKVNNGKSVSILVFRSGSTIVSGIDNIESCKDEIEKILSMLELR